jgi:protein-S-isoprenylcysteine O-methyltransferase Ste14
MSDAGEDPGVISMQPRVPPPLLMLLAAVLMWSMHRWWPIAVLLSTPWNQIGVLPIATGVVIAAAAVTKFRQSQTTLNPLDPGKASHLVTEGIFRFSRNPMYLGLLLLLIGWALWLGTASPWFVPPAFVIVIHLAQIVPEERALGALFGASYLEYRRTVARWFGRSGR